MSLYLIEPINKPNPKNLIGENYDLVLHQLTQALIAETHKDNPNFSQFINEFYKLMQSKTDPPIETIWVYSALSFRSHKTTSNDLSNRVSRATELFKLVSARSSPCVSSKSIVLLAPAVFEVYKLVGELLNKDLGDKRVKKLIKKVQSLVGLIYGYVSLCCSNDWSRESDSDLIVPFLDLIALWIDRKDDGLLEFLPLVSNGIRGGIRSGRCSVKHLAGVVIAEMMLLKLCFDLRVGSSKGEVDLEEELRKGAIGSITGFRSRYFFEILVEMLLDSDFPATPLLCSKDKTFSRKILYDVAILPEYSFLDPEREVDLLADDVRNLAMKRLIVTYEAVEFVREQFGDQKKAISYTSSFSNSQLSSQIIKWVVKQIGVPEEASRLNGLPPKSLLKRLWNLKRQGMIPFDDSISKYLSKFVVDDIKVGNEKTASKPESMTTEDLFFIDNKGDEIDENEDKEEIEAMSSAFVAAAQTMRLKESRGRKRKDTDSADRKKRMKPLELSDDSDSDREQSLTIHNADSNSESEVENPTYDED